MNEIMLFLPNQNGKDGCFATKLNFEKMIYFQNNKATYTGTGLFETTTSFIKPTYTILNCNNLVETDQITKQDLVLSGINADANIETFEIRPGQYVYHIIDDGPQSIIFKTKKDQKIHTLYSNGNIQSNYHMYRGRRHANKFLTQFFDALDSFKIKTTIKTGQLDVLSNNDIMEIAAKKQNIAYKDNIEIYVNPENTEVLITGYHKMFYTGYHACFQKYGKINGEIVNITGKQFDYTQDKKELLSFKQAFIKNTVCINEQVSNFCVEHHIALNNQHLCILHDPQTFDFKNLEHDPDVDDFVYETDKKLKSMGKSVNASNKEALAKLQRMNYKQHCKI